MKEISVKVQGDHLERISKVGKPILAVSELVWNSLDADSTEVRVKFTTNVMGGVERIQVSDVL